jgi:hypothetical protein
MAPVAWLLLSILKTQQGLQLGATRQKRDLFLGGLFLGVATVGYFVYAFFFPALLLSVVLLGRNSIRMQSPDRRIVIEIAIPWLGGLAIGTSTYLLGYMLLVRKTGGLSESIQFILHMQSNLGVFGSPLSFSERVHFSWAMLQSVLANWWHHRLMFGVYEDLPGSSLKTALLVIAPFFTWAAAELMRRASNTLRILIACPLSFMVMSLIFGDRLGGHHFMALLPIAYAALAIGLRDLTVPEEGHRVSGIVALSALFAVLLLLNVWGQIEEARWLKETRGVGLFSDAVNRLAHDLSSAKTKPFVYFPDWGLFMPVVLISRGSVPMSSEQHDAEARRMLCNGRDIAVALIEGDRAVRIKDWQQRLDWEDPTVVTYRQADGRPVFDLVTFSGNRNAPHCDSVQEGTPFRG